MNSINSFMPLHISKHNEFLLYNYYVCFYLYVTIISMNYSLYNKCVILCFLFL